MAPRSPAPVFDQLKPALRKAAQLEVDLRDVLRRELGAPAAASLRLDEHGRWAWRYQGATFTAVSFGDLVQKAAALRFGEAPRPAQQVELFKGGS